MKWDMNALDWRALFGQMHPDFFATEHIRALREDGRWDEMALDLKAFRPDADRKFFPVGTVNLHNRVPADVQGPRPTCPPAPGVRNIFQSASKSRLRSFVCQDFADMMTHKVGAVLKAFDHFCHPEC